MAGVKQREKDKAMAARMKREGVVRKFARCPICYSLKPLKSFYNHISTCGGRNG